MKDSDLEALQEDLLRWIGQASTCETGTLKYLLEMAVLEAENLRIKDLEQYQIDSACK